MSAATDRLAQDFAQTLLTLIQSGTAPWQKPWTTAGVDPFNPLSGSRYSGVNYLLLQLAAVQRRYADPRWVTFKQCHDAGGHVKKGESGTAIVRWIETTLTRAQFVRRLGREPTAEDVRRFGNDDGTFTLAGQRLYTVFNVRQTEGLVLPELRPSAKSAWDPIRRAEELMRASGAVFHVGAQSRAFYDAKSDSITLPARHQFPDPVDFYDTALHEMSHWTGHPQRLARNLVNPFGSKDYAREELVAEISSMMTAMRIGLAHRNAAHAAYVKSWLQALQNDPKEIFVAARQAARASDFLLAFEQQKLYCLDYEKGRAARLTPDAFCCAAQDCLEARGATEMAAANTRRNLAAGMDAASAHLQAVRWYAAPKAHTASQYHLGLEAFERPEEFLAAAYGFSPDLARKAQGVIAATLGTEALKHAQDLLPECDKRHPYVDSFWERARAERQGQKDFEAEHPQEARRARLSPTLGACTAREPTVDFRRGTLAWSSGDEFIREVQSLLRRGGRIARYWEWADRINHDQPGDSGRVWSAKYCAAATLIDPTQAREPLVDHPGIVRIAYPQLVARLTAQYPDRGVAAKIDAALEENWSKLQEAFTIAPTLAAERERPLDYAKEIAAAQSFWREVEKMRQERLQQGKDEAVDAEIARQPEAVQDAVKVAASATVAATLASLPPGGPAAAHDAVTRRNGDSVVPDRAPQGPSPSSDPASPATGERLASLLSPELQAAIAGLPPEEQQKAAATAELIVQGKPNAAQLRLVLERRMLIAAVNRLRDPPGRFFALDLDSNRMVYGTATEVREWLTALRGEPDSIEPWVEFRRKLSYNTCPPGKLGCFITAAPRDWKDLNDLAKQVIVFSCAARNEVNQKDFQRTIRALASELARPVDRVFAAMRSFARSERAQRSIAAVGNYLELRSSARAPETDVRQAQRER